MTSLERIRAALVAGQRLYAIVSVALIVLLSLGYALFYNFGIAPQLAQRQQLIQQLSSAQAQVVREQQAQQQAQTANQIQAQIDEVRQRIAQLAAAFLSEQDVGEILDNIYRYAAEVGVEIITLESRAVPTPTAQPTAQPTAVPTGQTTPAAPAATPAPAQQLYNVRPFGLQVSGTIPDLLGFVSRIQEASNPDVQISGVTIPEDQQLPDVLNMDITMYTSSVAGSGSTSSTTETSSALRELYSSLSDVWAAARWEQSIQLLARIRSLSPDDESVNDQLYAAHVNWGYELLQVGQPGKAAMQFGLALDVRPGGVEAMVGLERTKATPTPLAVDPPPTAPMQMPSPTPMVGPSPTANSYLVRPPDWPADWPWPPKGQ